MIIFILLISRVLDRLGPRALSSHLRRFCDYLAFELANSTSNVFQRVSLFVCLVLSSLVQFGWLWEMVGHMVTVLE